MSPTMLGVGVLIVGCAIVVAALIVSDRLAAADRRVRAAQPNRPRTIWPGDIIVPGDSNETARVTYPRRRRARSGSNGTS